MGYTIAFFHDIDKQYWEGKNDMEMLKQAIGSEYKGKPIAYELFSNKRDGTLPDAAKLFQQLLTEYFNHGETILEDNGETIPWELFLK